MPPCLPHLCFLIFGPFYATPLLLENLPILLVACITNLYFYGTTWKCTLCVTTIRVPPFDFFRRDRSEHSIP